MTVQNETGTATSTGVILSDAAASKAKALLDHTELPADQIVKKALEIAGELCIYTNMHHTIETL